MFTSGTYKSRRDNLIKQIDNGILFFPGNNETPMNYPANTFHFRQDSSFLYYFGLDQSNLAGIIDVDNNESIIFGDDRDIDDVVWMGFETPLKERAEQAGVSKTESFSKLKSYLQSALANGRKIHFLPQYKHDIIISFQDWLGIDPSFVNKYSSIELTKAVIAQRSVKSDEEVDEIEKALEVSYLMNTKAMKMARPGMIEREVYGAVEGIALSKGNGVSFPIIFSVHGETLHNHNHNNLMKDGDLLVLDSGAESLLHYASDITRSFPVSGKFTEKQKEIYNVVLKSQLEAIDMIKPGVKYKDVHLHSAKVIAEGLKELGLMKGNVDDAVKNGAHALFFPHGLGHMLGLDVHDLEGLGEAFVGYDEKTKRSDQFGLAYLRLARELEPGFVLTVEPGIYFIPQLIDIWMKENKHSDFINYNKVNEYRDFGGIRIEDDVLVTSNSYKVLGKPIPKTVEEVESTCNS